MKPSGRGRSCSNKPPPPEIEFDDSLPVVRKRREIAEAIERHPVTVVVGETGSGKSTQLPKICMAMGRGARGFIGHTQPRRIAARSVAARISAELGVEPGTAIGYKVRFNDRVSRGTFVKIMTDGILLAELHTDRRLDRYDTLIIDEAHERSINIDFLLGYLKRLLKRRRDLRVIITSATIDPSGFSRFFSGAPVIEVAGKSWPVEVRYRPADANGEPTDTTLTEHVAEVVRDLGREKAGDVLVFLPGEKEIRAVEKQLGKLRLAKTECVPLFARLSVEEQVKIFQPHDGRRIVLATNVAETSLTVPGIRYVVDTGLARISRYRPGRQVQALPVEAVSQAAANQRKGRCGRTAEGVCIRLYSEDDFSSRPAFTPPEILRTSLAAVILKMKSLALGDIGNFPFIDPPDARMIKDGYRLLEELGAISSTHKLTRTGRRLAQMPVDPRLGRMLLESGGLRCTREMLVVCAALSVQDPRLYPEHAREEAGRRHARYDDPDSDFVSLLNLWEAFHADTRKLSRRRRLEYCRERFLSPARMREWQDVHGQLKDMCRQMGLTLNRERAGYKPLHRAMLPGLMGNVAVKQEGREYLGTRGKALFVHPASAGRGRLPKWMVSAELVDTSRLYARTIARVEPGWIESAAAGLVRKSWSDPRWNPRRGQVTATERVTLYGLVIVAGRDVNYGPIDPVESRKVFIAGALVPGRLGRSFRFQTRNSELASGIERLEHAARRRDIMADDSVLYDFFDCRLPEGIYDLGGFSNWYEKVRADDPDVLCLGKEDLMRHPADHVTLDRFPDFMEFEGNRLPCRYHFEPGHPGDGVTVRIPGALLPQVRSEPFSWLVPGLLLEKVIALIRSLPKPLRRNFVPAADCAEKSLDLLDKKHGSLTHSLARALEQLTGVLVDDEDWNEAGLPAHLHMNYEVLDAGGAVAACGRNIEALRLAVADQTPDTAPAAAPDLERHGIVTWDFGELARELNVDRGGLKLTLYPALTDDNDSVAIRTFETRAEAAVAHTGGVRRLLCLQLPDHLRQLRKGPPGIDRMCLNFAGTGSCEGLRRDLVSAALDQVLHSGTGAGDIRTADAFDQRVKYARTHLVPVFGELCAVAAETLERYRECRIDVEKCGPETEADIRSQLEGLIYEGFVSATPVEHLRHLPRYLQAIQVRIRRAVHSPAKEKHCMQMIEPHVQRLTDCARAPASNNDAALKEYRWLLEEYRVSLFAQELGTAVPVSAKRLDGKWAQFTSKGKS